MAMQVLSACLAAVLKPPAALKRHKLLAAHGDERGDPYYWWAVLSMTTQRRYAVEHAAFISTASSSLVHQAC
jgi:hypothetical protein